MATSSTKKQQAIHSAAADETDAPLPSAPVENEAVLSPPVQGGGMRYMGTYSMPGMSGARLASAKVAALPVIVTAGDRGVLGVVVVSDPGVIGDALAADIAASGYRGPFTFELAVKATRAVKLAAAKVIATQQEPLLDRTGALMMLGYTPTQLLE